MQHDVLINADKVITVSWSWAELFKGYGAKDVSVITNGFDADDFSNVTDQSRNDTKLVIANIGTLEMDRNPRGLWKAIRQLIANQPLLRDTIEIHLAGKIDGAVLEDAGDLAGLIVNNGYVTHAQAVSLMQKADILLLPLNEIDTANTKGRIPGKIFEYIATGKPILMLGNSDSDSARIVTELGNSWCVANEDAMAIQQILVNMLSGQLPPSPQRPPDTLRYERRKLTQELAAVLEHVLRNPLAQVRSGKR